MTTLEQQFAQFVRDAQELAAFFAERSGQLEDWDMANCTDARMVQLFPIHTQGDNRALARGAALAIGGVWKRKAVEYGEQWAATIELKSTRRVDVVLHYVTMGEDRDASIIDLAQEAAV